MTRLPSLRPKDVVSALKRAGFVEVRQSGSHLHLEHPDAREVIVPVHTKDMKSGTLSAILKRAGLSLEAFLDLL